MDQATHIRKHSNPGFTIAELLVVVAIVGVLVAIAIPVFTASLDNAKKATDLANCRSAQAAATTECIASFGGDFEKMTAQQCVEVALSSGIPKHGQVDPETTLSCTIAADNNSVKFFYGTASDEGEGGDSETNTPSSITVTDSTGVKHTINVTGDWTSIQSQVAGEVAANGWDGVQLETGDVYSDSTGTYVVGWNNALSNVLDKTLGELSLKGNSLIKISNSTKIWTSTDTTGGRWKEPFPKKGDLMSVNGLYYLAPSDIGEWTLGPSGWISITQ